MEKNREQIETERAERALSTQKEMVDKPTLTWQNIKDLANSLTDEQLQKQVRYWSDNHGGKVGDANVLDEDYVSDGEAYAPISEMPAEAIDEDEPMFPKGTPMLWII